LIVDIGFTGEISAITSSREETEEILGKRVDLIGNLGFWGWIYSRA